MQSTRPTLSIVAAFGAFTLTSFAVLAAESAVHESARELPVAYDVDVVVVGGGTGAVSAAVAAAEAGASVFLAAPYPYLGDDMTATLRLWLEEGEQPNSALGKALYDDPLTLDAGPHRNRLDLTYTASLPTGDPHHDTVQAAKVHDGQEARYLNAVHTRRESLRELLLARALYRLGDHEGVGKATLEAYTADLRGHLARHAKAMLAE